MSQIPPKHAQAEDIEVSFYYDLQSGNVRFRGQKQQLQAVFQELAVLQSNLPESEQVRLAQIEAERDSYFEQQQTKILLRRSRYWLTWGLAVLIAFVSIIIVHRSFEHSEQRQGKLQKHEFISFNKPVC